MSKLASRWATEETLVNKAVEQDSKTPHHKPAPSLAPSKPAALPSKWADAPPSPTAPNPRQNHHKLDLVLPSGPKGAAGDEKRRPRRGSRHDRDNKESGRDAAKEPMSEFARSFADRLGVADNHQREQNRHENKPRSRRGKGHSRHEDRHESHDEEGAGPSDDIMHAKGPQTDAGNALALRLGLPLGNKASDHKADHKFDHKADHKFDHRADHKFDQRADHRADKGGAGGQQNAENKTRGKYMTPRQKKELAAREHQEKLRKEKEKRNAELKEANAEKEARLRQEVQDMLDKMSDKTTNWADFEDDE